MGNSVPWWLVGEDTLGDKSTVRVGGTISAIPDGYNGTRFSEDSLSSNVLLGCPPITFHCLFSGLPPFPQR